MSAREATEYVALHALRTSGAMRERGGAPYGWSTAERAMWSAYRSGSWCGIDGRVVRAAAVRYLLLARPDAFRGRQAALRLRGLAVEGRLDLSDCSLDVIVAFDGCTLTDRLTLDGVVVPALSLTGCRVPGIQADRIRVERSLTVTGSIVDGCIYLRDARIGSQLDLTGSTITPTGYSASGRPPIEDGRTPDRYVGIDAENMTVGGDLAGTRLTWYGGMFLNLARIDGAVILGGAQCPDGFIQAPSLVTGGLYAGHGFQLTGTINLYYATVNGPVGLEDARIDNAGAVAFGGWGVTVAGSITADGAAFSGAIDLQAADVRGSVHLANVRCSDPGPEGAVNLARAVIGGALTARGADLHGTIQLRHTRVGANVDLAAATLTGVDADNSALAANLDLTDATVSGPVTLRGAKVEGTVDIFNTTLVAIEADGLTCFQLVLMCHPPSGDIELSHATIHVLSDRATAWATGSGRLRLTDFTYRQLRNDVPVRERLKILHRATPTIEPQPYTQLAAVYRSAGRDRFARQVLLERLRRESRSGGWPKRAWGLIQDWTIGYGYLPGRAALIFVALLAAGTTYFATFAYCSGHPGLCPIDQTQHPRWDPFLYVLDLLIPLVDLGHEKTWDPTGNDKAMTVCLLLSGWVFATTLIAAAGRALRRSSEWA